MHSNIAPLLLAALLGATALPVIGQPVSSFERRELTFPMRDGTPLFAVALIPKNHPEPLPIILIRTPFGAAREFGNADVPPPYVELAEDGYIFVAQDIRGRFGSKGEFVTSRPQAGPGGVDESTDAYDTVDWLVKNLPGNNGRVGVIGMSYRGWLAGLAGVNPHPAIKAISPQAPTTDTWLGDDFFHQGAFRQTQGVAFTAWIESGNGFTPTSIDQFEYYLGFPTLDDLARATGISETPSWKGFREHPAWDAYWQARAMQNVLTRAEVPTLFVSGYWDQEDILGPQLGYRTVEKDDPRGWNRIALGPWFHGGWMFGAGDSIGPLPLGSNTSEYFRANIQRPWLAYYLHGKGEGKFPEAWAFETGGNTWRTFDAWPPAQAQPRKLYLRAGGEVSFKRPEPRTASRLDRPPMHTQEFDAFISDPDHPVPNSPRPDEEDGWRTWLQRDQRFVDNRPDVLTWRSEPLAEDLVIAGDIEARLFASTTGTDADWVVKLIDVWPEAATEGPLSGGYQLMVNADIMRGRYWKDFSYATPIPANEVTLFSIDLHQQLYRFRKGHRLMVQVQSSWFPLYDRNPQAFVPNIFFAKADDYRAQEHRVYHTPRYPSHIVLPVLAD